jgi:hypothetical protein
MSKGRRKPKLRDISRYRPTRDEIMAVFEMVYNGQPITAAILGAALVEHELEGLLRHRLARQSDADWEGLVGENGPLSTFNHKIIMGRALRLYDKNVEANLDIIRGIRNAFAHAKHLINFDHSSIVDALKSIKIPKTDKRGHREAKSFRYGATGSWLCLCHYTSMLLLRRHTLILRSANQRRKLNIEKISPLAQAIALGRLSQVSPLESFRLGQTFDPSHESPRELLSDFLPKALPSDDKADK